MADEFIEPYLLAQYDLSIFGRQKVLLNLLFLPPGADPATALLQEIVLGLTADQAEALGDSLKTAAASSRMGMTPTGTRQ